MKTTIALTAICYLLLSTPVTAQIYKWVDENGQTHFGDRAPPSVKSNRIEIKLKRKHTRLRIGTLREQKRLVNQEPVELQYQENAVILPSTLSKPMTREQAQAAECKYVQHTHDLLEQRKGRFKNVKEKRRKSDLAQLSRYLDDKCR